MYNFLNQIPHGYSMGIKCLFFLFEVFTQVSQINYFLTFELCSIKTIKA